VVAGPSSPGAIRQDEAQPRHVGRAGIATWRCCFQREPCQGDEAGDPARAAKNLSYKELYAGSVSMKYPSAGMSTRATAQLFLVVVLGIAFLATIAIGMYAAFVAPVETVSNVKGLVDALLPAETALLGAAVAFYFRGGPRDSGPSPPRS